MEIVNKSIQKDTTNISSELYCPLWRRLAAIVYDVLLLFCVVFIAWQPVPLLPDTLHEVLGRGIRLAYLTLISFLFFGWFWTHGGQTLGMKAWGIKLIHIGHDQGNWVNVVVCLETLYRRPFFLGYSGSGFSLVYISSVSFDFA